MKNLLTPKQVALAIDVSESSVKRWCDKGVIPTSYTGGGHRRIALPGLLRFLRSQRQNLRRPEVLGLPSATGRKRQDIAGAADLLMDALLTGDVEGVRRIALDLYLAEHRLAAVCDQVIAPAMSSIGEMWECGSAEVYQERRSCELVLRPLYEIGDLLPLPSADAPRALGAAPAGDQYHLATTMAELVLRDAGWHATSMGPNVPLESLTKALKQHRPRLFWLSCSHLEHEDEFIRGYNELYDEFGLEIAFIVGGRALSPAIRRRLIYAAFCDRMQHLEAFCQTLAPSPGHDDSARRPNAGP